MENKTLYTRCPTCNTAFKVTDKLLAMAGGKVRCGACLSIFQATDYMLEPSTQGSTLKENATSEQSQSLQDKNQQSQPETDQAIEQMSTQENPQTEYDQSQAEIPIDEFQKDLNVELEHQEQSLHEDFAQLTPDIELATAKSPIGLEKGQVSQFLEDGNIEEALSDTTSANDELAQAEIDSSATEPTSFEPVEEKIDGETILDQQHNEVSKEETAIEPVSNELENDQLQIDTEITAETEIDSDNDSDTEEIQILPDMDDSFIEDPLVNDDRQDTFSEFDSGNEAFNFEDEPSDFDQGFSKIQQEIDDIDSYDELSEQLSEQMQDTDSEPDPLDEFDDIVAENQTGIKTKLGLLVVSIIIIIGLQQIWTNRQAIAWNDTWGSSIKAVCHYLPCELKAKRDVSKIKLLQRQLSPDEEQENVLDIKILLINEADFAQPYPTIKIVFSNKNGEQVAIKTFTPANYLDVDSRDALMPFGSEVHIHFKTEITHPDALGFEFIFE